jgi:hypothetical protein
VSASCPRPRRSRVAGVVTRSEMTMAVMSEFAGPSDCHPGDGRRPQMLRLLAEHTRIGS